MTVEICFIKNVIEKTKEHNKEFKGLLSWLKTISTCHYLIRKNYNDVIKFKNIAELIYFNINNYSIDISDIRDNVKGKQCIYGNYLDEIKELIQKFQEYYCNCFKLYNEILNLSNKIIEYYNNSKKGIFNSLINKKLIKELVNEDYKNLMLLIYKYQVIVDFDRFDLTLCDYYSLHINFLKEQKEVVIFKHCEDMNYFIDTINDFYYDKKQFNKLLKNINAK